MNVTLTVDVGDEDRVVLVPRHENEYAAVGTVAEVTDHVRMRGGVHAVALEGLHRGAIGAAHSDALGRLRAEVEDRPDENPPPVQTRELEREYRAVVEEILELRDADERISQFLRSISEAGALADTCAYAHVSASAPASLIDRRNWLIRSSASRSSRISSTTARYSRSSSRVWTGGGFSSGRSSISARSRPSASLWAAPMTPRCRPSRLTAWTPPRMRTWSVTSATVPTPAYSLSWRGTRTTRSSSPTSTVRVTFIPGKTTVSSSGTSSRSV